MEKENRRFAVAMREALVIFLASLTLGFTYTMVTKRGFFTPKEQQEAGKHIKEVAPPTFISFDQAARLFDNGVALFVDARHAEDYKLGHIKGAINVPLKDFDTAKSRLDTIAKNIELVTYCDGADCNSSIELAQKLADEGFAAVRIFFGGWNEWRSHNMDFEKTDK